MKINKKYAVRVQMPAYNGETVFIIVHREKILPLLKKQTSFFNRSPRNLEIKAQIALLKYWEKDNSYINYEYSNHIHTLNNDHWKTTSDLFLYLFMNNEGIMVRDQNEYTRDSLTLSEWEAGDSEALMGYGGEQLLDKNDNIIYKWQTWMN